jgi:hypothetical protein
MCNLAIDSKLRGCDVVKSGSRTLLQTDIPRDCAQEKTGRSVRFEFSEQTHQAIKRHRVVRPHGAPASAGASAARPGRRPVAFRSDSLARTCWRAKSCQRSTRSISEVGRAADTLNAPISSSVSLFLPLGAMATPRYGAEVSDGVDRALPLHEAHPMKRSTSTLRSWKSRTRLGPGGTTSLVLTHSKARPL